VPRGRCLSTRKPTKKPDHRIGLGQLRVDLDGQLKVVNQRQAKSSTRVSEKGPAPRGLTLVVTRGRPAFGRGVLSACAQGEERLQALTRPQPNPGLDQPVLLCQIGPSRRGLDAGSSPRPAAVARMRT